MTITEAHGIIPRINAGDHGITLVMSHLACAENLNHPLNAKQLATFREIASLFPACRRRCRIPPAFLGRPVPVSMWCGREQPSTASIPTPRGRQSDAAGGRPQGPHRADRNIEKAESVGYGGTWTTRRPTRLAIVSAGYADGYFRAGGSNDGTRGARWWSRASAARLRAASRWTAGRRHHRPAEQRRAPRSHGERCLARHHRSTNSRTISAPSLRSPHQPRPALCPGLQGGRCGN